MEYREVRTFAEEYFAGSSALNRRILEDIASVRTSCSQDWDTLPVLQQDQVTSLYTPSISQALLLLSVTSIFLQVINDHLICNGSINGFTKVCSCSTDYIIPYCLYTSCVHRITIQNPPCFPSPS